MAMGAAIRFMSSVDLDARLLLENGPEHIEVPVVVVPECA
jgi:hypothetical protein